MNTSLMRYLARLAVVILFACPIASPQSSATATEKKVTFRAETNLVLVPVVVRDSKGNAAGNLRKEDFRLFDNGRSQAIASFAVEEMTPQVAGDRSLPSADRWDPLPAGVTLLSGAPKDAPMVIPSRFIALVFDDYHLPPDAWGYLVWARDAARRYLATLKPADRVAILTTTGETALDFTSDRAKLEEALLKLHPGPQPNPPSTPAALGMPKMNLTEDEWEARRSVEKISDIVRRMSVEPGQRTMVLLSPGFAIREKPTWSLLPDTMSLIDRSIRCSVVIDTFNVRGLDPDGNGPDELLFRLADGTGGTYVRDRNDSDSAMHQLAAAPEYRYVLGFSPDELKQDGSLHELKVSLKGVHGLEVQARRAYWDAKPGQEANEAVQAARGKSAAETPQVSEAETREVAEALDLGPAAPKPAAVTTPAQPPVNDEITTRDEPATFKAQTNLVEVPVVVRDRDGRAVGNLRKEDFRVLDKGKRQEITKFFVQKAAAPATIETRAKAQPSATPEATPPPVAPDRFVAFVFDDVHLQFVDLPQVRDAVRRYIRSSLQPGDRAALFTTSGKVSVDFTTKAEALDEALLRIRPSPFTASALRTCLYVTYSEAVQVDQQVSLHPTYPDDLARSVALRAAVYDAGLCLHINDARTLFDIAVQEIRDAFTNGKQETRANLAVLSNLVRHMAVLPGQRNIILASPGFFVSPELQDQGSDLIALAIRSKVLISTIDARGVWTDSTFDASLPAGAPPPPEVIAFKDIDGTVGDDELIALAEGTGGTVNLNNDFDGGIRKAAAAPEYLYILGFVPQNLKLDGNFHALKVTLNRGEKASVQARRGYWAPKRAEGADAVAKQEIENAVFSRDEIHDLPVEMHTQVTTDGGATKLNVLAGVDLRLIHLRKADGRNRNDVRIIATLFDENGNFIAGTEKILELRLRDETVQGLAEKPPITITTGFDVKPGVYLVRLVARDAEGQQLTTENASVQIP